MKHIPERSCIVCRRKAPKSEFIRIVRKSDGTIVLDEKGTEAGRGAYVCKSAKCIADVAKKRALDRTFKEKISAEAYDAVIGSFGELPHA